ncbi:hypothetical protein C8Q73DRAFT_661519 [Cubamyces lactineus]|nr:hypothetical protein C8Q73DRAFT_661519 [Cubamyces lactineus]
MVKQGVKGRIVFVSSVLAFFSIVGYSPYSPGKFALRGLAETLHSELKLYGISVHIAFPATIYTPGYEEENKTKPKVTLKIEESDSGDSPEAVAAAILKGVQKGNFHVTTGFLGELFRSSAAGASPRPSYILDIVYGMISFSRRIRENIASTCVGKGSWRDDGSITSQRTIQCGTMFAKFIASGSLIPIQDSKVAAFSGSDVTDQSLVKFHMLLNAYSLVGYVKVVKTSIRLQTMDRAVNRWGPKKYTSDLERCILMARLETLPGFPGPQGWVL